MLIVTLALSCGRITARGESQRMQIGHCNGNVGACLIEAIIMVREIVNNKRILVHVPSKILMN